jgi:hypothetical protein
MMALERDERAPGPVFSFAAHRATALKRIRWNPYRYW